MAYKQDLRGAARRHLLAAQVLYQQEEPGMRPGCMFVAGYLFGIAGELAVKEMMRDSGIRPTTDVPDDPYYAHFPALKTLLREAPGRRSSELRKLAEDSRLFQNWDIRMRYAPTTDVQSQWIESWKNSAEELINRMAGV